MADTLALASENAWGASCGRSQVAKRVTWFLLMLISLRRFECDDDNGYFRDTHHQVWVRNTNPLPIVASSVGS